MNDIVISTAPAYLPMAIGLLGLASIIAAAMFAISIRADAGLESSAVDIELAELERLSERSEAASRFAAAVLRHSPPPIARIPHRVIITNADAMFGAPPVRRNTKQPRAEI